jgi:type IV secretion system protein VirB8
VKSVIFLNERTAAVRFQTTRKSERENVSTDWVANVRFRYTSEPMRNDWRFDNPLGFQVLEYRRDQETIGAKTETPP